MKVGSGFVFTLGETDVVPDIARTGPSMGTKSLTVFQTTFGL